MHFRALSHLLMKCTTTLNIRPRKKMFVSCNGPKKGVCRSGKSFSFFFLKFQISKMCVLCIFFYDWDSGGLKKL